MIRCPFRTLSVSRLGRVPQTHGSLEDFIHHASLNRLDLTSTVYRGTLYEYTVLETLSTLYGFQLYRTGGADDRGIDLRGTWRLPTVPTSSNAATDHATLSEDVKRVVIQCKHEAKKIGPRHVRELNGIARGPDTLSILVSSSTFTEKARQALMTSPNPICLAVIQEFNLGGALRQFIWNREAGKTLQGLEVRVVHGKGDYTLKLYHHGRVLNSKKRSRKETTSISALSKEG